MRGNVYLLVVLANLLLTFGNALLGKKYGHLHTLSIVGILFAGKFLVGAACYAFLRQDSIQSIAPSHILAIFGIGILLGIGELLLFAGLAKETYVVAALGCLYPIGLTAFAFLLSGEPPTPRRLLAIVISSLAIWLAR